jgi:protein SCO1/2
LAVPLLLLLAGCARREPLPVYGKVPAFTLTSEQGLGFRAADLDGKVWVANFIFTNCTGPCPRMSSLIQRLQEETKDVRFVSFTVDPARDTPEALAAYARRYRADRTRWHFLTGTQDALHTVMRHSFKLGDVDNSMTHSTRFVLVDGLRQIRGFYSTDDAGDMQRLRADIRDLLAARGQG